MGFMLALGVMLPSMFLANSTNIWGDIRKWSAIAFVGLALASLVLLLANLAVMRRYHDRFRLLKRFGLKGVVDSSWKTAPTGMTMGGFWTSLGFALGAIWSLVGTVAFVGVLFLGLTLEEKFTFAFYVFLFTTPGVLLVAFYILRRAHRRNTRLTDLNLFGKLLEKRRAAAEEGSSDAIEWSPRLRRQLEQIERARIRRQRSDAIQESFATKSSVSYGVVRSTKSLLAALQLSGDAAAGSETLIQQLAADPRPECAEQDGELWKLADSKLGVEVHYEINDADRFVRVRNVVGPDTLAG